MGKRFVRAHDADKRAIRLHLALEALKQMPEIGVIISDDQKSIVIFDQNNRTRFWNWSIDMILSFDLEKTKANGGTVEALIASRRYPKPRVPQSEVDEGVRQFLTGNDD